MHSEQSVKSDSMYELAAPAVRNLAVKHKILLKNVVATGKDGRIMKQDVLKYLDRQQQQQQAKCDGGVARPITEQKNRYAFLYCSLIHVF